MTDLEFARKCAKGDKLAWDEFVDRYSRLIYSYIHSVLRIKGIPVNQESISDLFQEIFLILIKDNFKKLKTFKAKNGCSLATWLRQVTINYTLDYIRKLKPVVSIEEEINDELTLKEILTDNNPTITDKLAQNERFAQLKDCIEWLNNEDKYFLELHLNRGLTLEEMRAHLGITRGAIDMRKARIVERLKECFKEKGFYFQDRIF